MSRLHAFAGLFAAFIACGLGSLCRPEQGKDTIESSQGPCLTARVDQAVVRGLTFKPAISSGTKVAYTVELGAGRLIMENCIISAGTKGAVRIRGAAANPMMRFCKLDCGAGT